MYGGRIDREATYSEAIYSSLSVVAKSTRRLITIFHYISCRMMLHQSDFLLFEPVREKINNLGFSG